MRAYQVKISLNELEVWRRVVFPADITFYGLHRVIQYSMGWFESHLYEFEVQSEKLVIVDSKEEAEELAFYNSQPAYDGRVKEPKIFRTSRGVKIDRYLNESYPMRYIYDMGDYWEHEIVLEKVIEDYEFVYPMCLDGDGACPPEDCGGVGGYLELLAVMSDCNHPDYEEIMEWLEDAQYEDFNLKNTNHWMKELKLKRVKKS